MKYNKDLTVDELKKNVHYCPDSGVFTRVLSRANSVNIGDEIKGTRHGYICMRINGCTYPAHRLAFLYMTGEWPKGEVDHISQVRNDNRFLNLRDVTRSINQKNTRQRKDNTSGVKGVFWNKANSNWRAVINSDKKKINLGSFSTLEDATLARLDAESELGFTENHGRSL